MNKSFSYNTRYICTEDGINLYVSSNKVHSIQGLKAYSDEEYACKAAAVLEDELKAGAKSLVKLLDGNYSIEN